MNLWAFGQYESPKIKVLSRVLEDATTTIFGAFFFFAILYMHRSTDR